MKQPPRATRGDLAAFLTWHGITLSLPPGPCVRPLHKTPNRHGYFQTRFGGLHTYIHRLALQLKLGRPVHPDLETRHVCGNSSCANPWHLEEGTSAQNIADQYAHGTRVMGERHPAAKLTEEQVNEIRILAAEGEVSQSDIASQFGVVRQTISDIKRGRRRLATTKETRN